METYYPRHSSMTVEEIDRALVSCGGWVRDEALRHAEERAWARLQALRSDDDRWLGMSYEDEAPR